MRTFVNRRGWIVPVVLAGLAMLVGCDNQMGTGQLPTGMNLGKGQYTILLETQHGPFSFEKVKTYREIIASNTGWPESDLLLVRNEREQTASLYYGTFDGFDAAVDRLLDIRKIKTDRGNKPFSRGLVQVVPAPGTQIGPKQWNLENAKGDFTLCVGKWHNMPDKNFFLRRENAVLHCKRLRDKGYEAYYFHGDLESIVTVGLFQAGEVRIRRDRNGRQEITSVSPRIRKLQADPEVGRFLENGWNQQDVTVLLDARGTPRLDATGEPIRQKTPIRSFLVYHPSKRDRPASLPDNASKEPEDAKDPFDSRFPKPW
jgi:hypothetical protein